MKLRWVILFAICFFIMNPKASWAHGVIYKLEQQDPNKLKIHLQWDDSTEERGIYPLYYQIEKGKILTVGYAVKDMPNPSPYLTFDLRQSIPPMRIVLREVGENTQPIFTDIKGSYAEEYIQNLHDAGIVSGMPDGSYRPYELVTRAEFMAMLCKLLNIDTTILETEFSDTKQHWAKGILQAAANRGFIKGFPDKSVKPDKPITVAEACVVMDKAYTFKSAREGYFHKLQRGKWFSFSVKKMFDAGIITIEDPLYRDFDEDAPLNRSDIAMFLSRANSTY